MAITIGSNIASLQAQRRLGDATSSLGKTLARLSSGTRINSPSDDSAGMAVALSLGVRSRVYGQAMRNINDSISAITIAQSSLDQSGSILIRLKELATQSSSGNYSSTQRQALDQEAFQLTREFNRIIDSTKFNGLGLLDGSLASIVAQLGFGADETIFGDLNSALRRVVGTGTFGSTTDSLSGGGAALGVAVGDFNGDGIVDIAASDNFGGGARANYGDGTGSFGGSTILTGITSYGAIAAGDFDGDGYDDVVVADSNRVRLYRGSASGLSTTETTNVITSTANISQIRVDDLDSDGDLDFAVSGGSATLSIVRNDGSNSLALQGTIANTATVVDFELGDADGDGITDIYTNGTTGALGRIFRGTGSLSFSLFTTFSAQSSERFAVSDLNNDGLSDIVLGSGSLLINSGGGAFSSSSYSIGTAGASSNLLLKDFNNDGILDIFRPSGQGEVSFGRGDGTFDTHKAAGFAPYSNSEFADFNGDGILDYFGGSSAGTAIRLGQSTFSTKLERVSLFTAEDALEALDTLESYFTRVGAQNGILGAALSRLERALSVVARVRDGSLEAQARITDIDVAQESSELTRQSILQNSAAGILAQANQAPNLVLSLLQS
jgi:flagellin